MRRWSRGHGKALHGDEVTGTDAPIAVDIDVHPHGRVTRECRNSDFDAGQLLRVLRDYTSGLPDGYCGSICQTNVANLDTYGRAFRWALMSLSDDLDDDDH